MKITSTVYLTGALCSLFISPLKAQNTSRHPFDVAKNLHKTTVPASPVQFSSNAGNESKLSVIKSTAGDLRYEMVIENGAPLMLAGKAKSVAAFGKTSSIFDVHHAAITYLTDYKDVLHISDPKTEFVVTAVSTDEKEESHIRMKQVYKGLPVYGSEVILHTNQNSIAELNGRFYPTPLISTTTPSISAATATGNAINNLKSTTTYRTLSELEKQVLKYENPTSELVIYPVNKNYQAATLAWHISIRPNFMESWEYFVDAQTGAILKKYNKTCSVDGPRSTIDNDLNGVTQTVNTYQVGSNYYLIDASKTMFNSANSVFPNHPDGVIWTLDAQNTAGTSVIQLFNTSNSWNNKSVSAHYNAGKVYDYYMNRHSRNSINGMGGNIISIINVSDSNGTGLDNAYWNGQAMFYGNGNTKFKPLAGSLDIAGHEMTHGVIEAESGMEYEGQSGAIAESLADIFGCMMDSSDWLIGEDVVQLSAYPSGAMRNMQDPHNGTTQGNNGWQPKHMNEYYAGTDDHKGVHMNSGILNYVYYQIATNTTKIKAEKIYYRALTQYLTRSAQFIDLRLAVVKSASNLYGASSAEVAAVKSAFDNVGIYDAATAVSQAVDLPVSTGSDFIIMYDPDFSHTSRLTATDTAGINRIPLTTTWCNRKPSVTDNGQLCVFVDTSHRIRSINLTGQTNETVIDNQPIWENAVVSKDGNKIAAVTTSIDTAIYVYDVPKQEWHKFHLYNPTHSDIRAGGVLFADAFDWDNTGQYLVYDSKNKINDSITYWDISRIRVWNNSGNSWGSGDIDKIFSQLPNNVSVANPTFSKNSPYIIVFDYYNLKDSSFSIRTKNLVTGASGNVIFNNKVGFPSFSKTDGKVIYETIDLNIQGYAIYSVNMRENKLDAIGGPIMMLPHSTWATWCAVGNRQLISSDKNIISFSLPTVSPAAVGVITNDSIIVHVPTGTDLTNLTADFSASAFCTVMVGNTEQISGASSNNYTGPVTYTVIAQNGSSKTYKVYVIKPSNAKDILSYSFAALTPPAVGVIVNDSIYVVVPTTTNASNLVATFTLSPLAKAFVSTTIQVSGTTANDFTTPPVIYTVMAEDSSTKDYRVYVHIPTGINEMQSLSRSLSVYPNPTTGVLNTNMKGDFQYEIYDVLGNVIIRANMSSPVIDVRSLPAGVYLLRVQSSGEWAVKKFTKQ